MSRRLRRRLAVWRSPWQPSWCVAGAQAPRINLLLVTLDTVRADHLGKLRVLPRRPHLRSTVSPAKVCAFATRRHRRRSPVRPTPRCSPAHYPARYDVRDNGDDAAARRCRDAGVGPAEGRIPDSRLHRGVHSRSAVRLRPGVRSVRLPLRTVRGRRQAEGRAPRRPRSIVPALAWLGRTRRDRPFFVWVHLYDAHAPYSAPAPYRTRFPQPPYDGEVAYVDSAVAKLIAQAGGDGRAGAHARGRNRRPRREPGRARRGGPRGVPLRRGSPHPMDPAPARPASAAAPSSPSRCEPST